jgi:hypothetical protein
MVSINPEEGQVDPEEEIDDALKEMKLETPVNIGDEWLR